MLALALSGYGQVQETAKAARSGAKAEAVQYLYPEQVTVPAGKRGTAWDDVVHQTRRQRAERAR